MFSLIIVILSIVLVAFLALVVMYYGGSSIESGTAKADASKLLNQGQQLMGAADLYRSDTGAWPTSIPELISKSYLKAMPVPHNGKDWVMPVAGNPTFVLEDVRSDTCKTVNSLSLKVDGVFKTLSAAYATQCYSPGQDSFTVVVTKAGTNLTETGACPAGTSATGIPGLGTVECKPIPTDCDDPGWAVKPSYCNTGGPGVPPVDPPPVEPPPVPETKGKLQISNVDVQFPKTPVGLRSMPYSMVTLKNVGGSPVSVDGIASEDPALFYADMGDCIYVPTFPQLPPGESCPIYIEFAPVDPVTSKSSAVLSSSEGPVSLNLQGEGFAAIDIEVTEGATTYTLGYDEFGLKMEAAVGQSFSRTVTVRNKSPYSGAVHPRWRSYYYDHSIAYRHGLTQTSTCGQTMAPNGTCTITVTYRPLDAFPGTEVYPFAKSWLHLVAGPGSPSQSPTDELRYEAPVLTISHHTIAAKEQLDVQIEMNVDDSDYTALTFKVAPGKNLNMLNTQGGGMRNLFIQDAPSVTPQHYQRQGLYLPEFSGEEYSVYLSHVSRAPEMIPVGTEPSAWGPTLTMSFMEVYTPLSPEFDFSLPNQNAMHQYWCVKFEVAAGSAPTFKSAASGMCSGAWAAGTTGIFKNAPPVGADPAAPSGGLGSDTGGGGSGGSGGSGGEPPQTGVKHYIAEGGPNVYEVPVTALPYTDGCSGGAYTFNTCARNRIAEGTGKSCTLYRVENSWAFPGNSQSRISCQ